MNADQNVTTLAATIHNLRCGMSVAGPAAKPYLQSVDDDLSKAMSEHAALVAVACHEACAPSDPPAEWDSCCGHCGKPVGEVAG